jgi:hypothetical protein
MSKRLSQHYRGALLRVKGSGRWVRERSGAWKMLGFDIKDFEALDDAPLAEVMKRLRETPGADWGDDSLGDIMRLRNGDGTN